MTAMDSFDRFWNEFQAKFSRAPVWLPGVPMQLGDIGVIDRRGYIRQANLTEDFDIQFEQQASDASPEYYVSSSHARSQDFDATTSTPDAFGAVAQLAASMQVSFSASDAFVVRANQVQSVRIKNVLAVEREIQFRPDVSAYWKRDWIYVQEVVTAQPCIMLVSAASGGNATIKAKVSGALVSFAQLFNAGAALSMGANAAIDQYVLSSDRTALMWRGRWLKRRGFQDRGGDDERGTPEDNDDAEEYPYEDFDDPSLFGRDVPPT
jgi:hypothetical protein